VASKSRVSRNHRKTRKQTAADTTAPGDADDLPDALVWLALTAETVEFPVSDAAEKSMPLV
jgi:hypothetical protein